MTFLYVNKYLSIYLGLEMTNVIIAINRLSLINSSNIWMIIFSEVCYSVAYLFYNYTKLTLFWTLYAVRIASRYISLPGISIDIQIVMTFTCCVVTSFSHFWEQYQKWLIIWLVHGSKSLLPFSAEAWKIFCTSGCNFSLNILFQTLQFKSMEKNLSFELHQTHISCFTLNIVASWHVFLDIAHIPVQKLDPDSARMHRFKKKQFYTI